MTNLIKQQLKGYFINNLQIPNFEKSLERIKKLGYTPKVIFDIGAYKGDFAKLCLNQWETSNVVCFEPLEEKCKILEKWAKEDKRIKVIHGLLGDENQEEVKFNESETASSVLDEYISKDFKTKSHKMRTLDTCIKEFNLDLPSLVKIDTQGYEYQILNGFMNNLKDVDIIIAELNHIDIHKNVRLAEEVINLLYLNGFTIYDILEVHRRPFDNAIWQTDFMFVKKNSFLRENKQWK
jgi:FkbM family methyltransferase